MRQRFPAPGSTPRTQVASKEVRDAIIDSGMEGGVQAGWDILEQIAISLR